MSIASRITSMENNIRNAYHGLDSIGIDTTNTNKNIENISSLLDDFYDSLPKVSGSGTNINLTPTLKGRITSQINGDTFQQTYTGKNLFNKTDYSTITTANNGSPTNVSKTSDKISFTSNSNSGFSGIYITPANYQNYIDNYDSETTYYISADIKTDVNCDFRFAKESIVTPITAGTTRLTYSGTTPPNIAFYVKNATANIEITNIMISTSSDTTYEKYVGGTASPNPDYPQEIQSVTGLQKINVCGKNRLNLASGTSSINNTTIKITNDIINFKVDGTTTYASYGIDGELRKANYGNYIPWNNKILKAGTYTLSIKYVSGATTTAQSSGNMLNATIYGRDISSTAAYPNNIIARTYVETTDNSITFTIAEDQEINVVIYLYSSSQPTIDINFKVQLEKGSTATTYEAYSGETYDINLGDIELNKIPNTTADDYITGTPDNWSIVKQIGTKTLNGTEIITHHSVSQGSLSLFRFKNTITDESSDTTYTPLSNYYQGLPFNQYSSRSNNKFYIKQSEHELDIIDNRYTDVDDYKTWLSTHNVKIVYELATPTTTPITDTELISQLNAFYYAKSKQGQTNISVDGNLPIILDVSALKEVE